MYLVEEAAGRVRIPVHHVDIPAHLFPIETQHVQIDLAQDTHTRPEPHSDARVHVVDAHREMETRAEIDDCKETPEEGDVEEDAAHAHEDDRRQQTEDAVRGRRDIRVTRLVQPNHSQRAARVHERRI